MSRSEDGYHRWLLYPAFCKVDTAWWVNKTDGMHGSWKVLGLLSKRGHVAMKFSVLKACRRTCCFSWPEHQVVAIE